VLPEAYANHASVDDCIGYPPLFMHTTEFDTCRDPAIQFVQKVEKARSFAEFHLWGGLSHCNKNFSGEPCPPLDEMNETIDRNIATCFRCDLRRPWVYSDEK
jgi:acetyl esterase/lipase